MKELIVEKDNGTTHRLINSDFFDVDLDFIPDLILTDPPFNTTNAKWDTKMDLENMWGWLSSLRVERTPVLLFSQLPFDKVLGVSNLKELRYEWVWEKTAGTGFLNAKKMPLKCHENILVFYKKLPLYNQQKTYGHKPTNSYTKHTSDGELYGKTTQGISGGGDTSRCPRDVLLYPSDKQKLSLNSTQKPVDLLRYFIRTYTNKGDTILDFTAGSMSLTVASYLEGRNSVCIERDEEQFNKAVKWVVNCSLDDVYKTTN